MRSLLIDLLDGYILFMAQYIIADGMALPVLGSMALSSLLLKTELSKAMAQELTK